VVDEDFFAATGVWTGGGARTGAAGASSDDVESWEDEVVDLDGGFATVRTGGAGASSDEDCEDWDEVELLCGAAVTFGAGGATLGGSSDDES